jgi:hypothetical protein
MKLFEELKELDLVSYMPPPVRRIYVPKPDGRQRPLGIPTIKDRVMRVKNALEPEWEARFEGTGSDLDAVSLTLYTLYGSRFQCKLVNISWIVTLKVALIMLITRPLWVSYEVFQPLG